MTKAEIVAALRIPPVRCAAMSVQKSARSSVGETVDEIALAHGAKLEPTPLRL